ncbi:MAG: hypothetical protein FJ313_04935, partial [Gemmatimonadetes bacterium]|nr:hypothetical protein [Gemmatimonadota bacterium]
QPCPSVTDLARNADTLLCMCWDDQETMDANGESPGQTGTVKAAEMAREAGVGQLVLVHMGRHITTHGVLEKGIGDVQRIYGGRVIFAEELMTLEV